jgi:hypothetical protein
LDGVDEVFGTQNLLTMDVVFELINRELLITDYAFDKIPD